MAGRQIHAGTLEDASAQDDMVGKFLHKISARHSTDKKGCWIIGSVLLPGGCLAVVDQLNRCVKLFDLQAMKLTGKVSLTLEPRDITAIGENQLAVVSEDERFWQLNEQHETNFKHQDVQYLQMLRVTLKLARSITLPLPGRAYGTVTCRGEKIYLSCVEPQSIQICDLHGKLLCQINCRSNEGEWLYLLPGIIAVSPDGASIYVCDRYKVLYLTTEGRKVWTFRSYHSYLLIGNDVDKQGRLFVWNDPTITILSSAGRQGTLKLDNKVLYPLFVAVGDGRMYLSSSINNNEIDVFRLEAADSARQVCEDLSPPVDQSMILSGNIPLCDTNTDRESYRSLDNNRYDSPSENQRLDLSSHTSFSDTNRDGESYRLPGNNRSDSLLEDREEEPPVKLPKFE